MILSREVLWLRGNFHWPYRRLFILQMPEKGFSIVEKIFLQDGFSLRRKNTGHDYRQEDGENDNDQTTQENVFGKAADH